MHTDSQYSFYAFQQPLCAATEAANSCAIIQLFYTLNVLLTFNCILVLKSTVPFQLMYHIYSHHTFLKQGSFSYLLVIHLGSVRLPVVSHQEEMSRGVLYRKHTVRKQFLFSSAVDIFFQSFEMMQSKQNQRMCDDGRDLTLTV